MSKTTMKEEDEGEAWDAPRKKNIDEWGNSRTRTDSDFGKSRDNCSKLSTRAGGNAAAARGSLDYKWDPVPSQPAELEAHSAKLRVKVQMYF